MTTATKQALSLGQSFYVELERMGYADSAAMKREHTRLLKLWATGRATKKQMERCMELDRAARVARAEE